MTLGLSVGIDCGMGTRFANTVFCQNKASRKNVMKKGYFMRKRLFMYFNAKGDSLWGILTDRKTSFM